MRESEKASIVSSVFTQFLHRVYTMNEDAIVKFQKHWRGYVVRKDFRVHGKCINSVYTSMKNRDKQIYKLATILKDPSMINVVKMSPSYLTGAMLYETLLHAYTFCKLNNIEGEHVSEMVNIMHFTSKKIRSKNRKRKRC